MLTMLAALIGLAVGASAAAALLLFSAAVVADQFDVHAICLYARAYVRATPRYLLA